MIIEKPEQFYFSFSDEEISIIKKTTDLLTNLLEEMKKYDCEAIMSCHELTMIATNEIDTLINQLNYIAKCDTME